MTRKAILANREESGILACCSEWRVADLDLAPASIPVEGLRARKTGFAVKTPGGPIVTANVTFQEQRNTRWCERLIGPMLCGKLSRRLRGIKGICDQFTWVKPTAHSIHILPGLDDKAKLLSVTNVKFPSGVPKYEQVASSLWYCNGLRLVRGFYTDDPVRFSSFDWPPISFPPYFHVSS